MQIEDLAYVSSVSADSVSKTTSSNGAGKTISVEGFVVGDPVQVSIDGKNLVLITPAGKKLKCKGAAKLVTVQVVNDESEEVRYRGTGLVGAIQGTQTGQVVYGVKAIISGEHVQLLCAEAHHVCSPLGADKPFSGELNEDDIWITQTIPLTHMIVRNHFKISGGW